MKTTRRRFIGITATLSATALLPQAFAQTSSLEPVIWRGVALGADAELRLYHPNRAIAEHLIQLSLNEVARLEKIFSIYRDDSQISQLNRTGILRNPSADLLSVLSQSRSLHSHTQGAFDPTVQTLWQRHAQHFAQFPNSHSAPNTQALRQRIGFQYVQFDGKQVAFQKPNMAMTLNGIAQGYITDRITQLLQQHGMKHALVNMGEIRHLDTLNQYAESAKIHQPRGNGVLPNIDIPLQNQALATSSPYGTTLDANGQFSHLFHPHTTDNRPRYQSVTVRAKQASLADGLSTAFAVSPERTIQTVAQKLGAKVWLVKLDGTHAIFG